MNFDEYQKRAKKTAIYPNIGNNIVYPTIGLAGEAGEIANKVKKIIRDDSTKLTLTSKKELSKELGDVLWYVASMSWELGISLEKIAQENIEKITSRKKRNTVKGSGDNR